MPPKEPGGYEGPGLYRHYKTGTVYTVTGTAVWEADRCSRIVIYVGDGVTWWRRINNFNERLVLKGQDQTVPRFLRIGDAPG